MAIPTLTYYSVSADLTTLSAVLNGVAMICKQNALIWGFALMVAMYRLLTTSTAAVLRSPGGQGGAVLGSGPLNTLMPFILAMSLTNSALQGTVQIESTINGAVTEVDNVPLVISAIPAAGSILSMNLNEVVSTAFGDVDSEYPTISATANGFLNPLKLLLTSRTAMYRLNGVDSEVKSVLSACLGPDSGVNYASIETLVQNAGNTGATTSQSIALNGANPTAMGALLYQATLNTTALVDDAALGTQDLNCTDAVNKVADDITTALSSTEFTRVIQGAVNGMDQPIPGADYSFETIAAQYDATSRANTLGSVFTGGTGQSNAEFMNLLFSEMVENDINCLRASADTLVQCQATSLQASEVERNNLSMAASEVPMLRYAGSFGNYLIALIIGLGPVIVMFMMFAGVEAGKCVKTVAHLTVWPLLVVNVGAELVNGMICIDVANYLTSLRQGGWISQASTLAAYQELSLQIGTGSHIMASLPVLMSMIFGLGETSALTSVATSIAPKSKDVADNMAATPEATRPMFENGSIAKADQYAHGAGNLQFTGSTNAVSTSTSFGNMAREASNTLAQSDTRSQSISAGRSNLADWREAISSGNFKKLGVDQSIGESVANDFRSSQRAADNAHANTSLSGTRQNANKANAGMQGSFGVGGGEGGGGGGGGGGGMGFHANVGASGGTSTEAVDALTGSDSRGRSKDYTDSVDLARAISKTMSKFQNSSAGQQASSELARSLSTQENYQQSLSDVKSTSDSAAQAVRDTSGFVDQSSSIGTNEIVWQNQKNTDFKAFQLLSGRQFQENSANQPYIQKAAAEAASGASGRVENDAQGQEAVTRHRAAVMLAQDGAAKPEDRMAATRYLTEEANAMQHMRFEPTNTAPLHMDIAAPSDNTGVNSRALRSAANGRTSALPVPAVPAARGPASGLSASGAPSQALAHGPAANDAGPAANAAQPAVRPAATAEAAQAGQSARPPLERGPDANGGEPAVRSGRTAGEPAAATGTTAAHHGVAPVAAGTGQHDTQPHAAVRPAAAGAPAARNVGEGNPAHPAQRPEHAAAEAKPSSPATPAANGAHPPGRPAPAAPEATLPTGATPQLPAASRPDFNLDPGLVSEVTTRMNAMHGDVEKSVKGAEALEHNSGLDAQGHGTVIRTAANVADNLVDVGRAAGSSSRTRLGNTDAPAPAPEKQEPAPKSHFVRRGPG